MLPTIRPLIDEDWPEVEQIYLEGIADKMATFETKSPGWENWNASHHPFCRFVISDPNSILGWIALLPVSKRKAYSGVAELSVYVSKQHQGKGLGKKLMTHLIDQVEDHGIWTLQSSLFPENKASYTLHKTFGFREVGYREKIGKMDGIWRNTVLMERRSKLDKFLT